MINLKPCPFCGGEAHFEWDGHSHDDIGCGDPDCIGHHIACHYVNDDPKEKRELVKSWNTRSPQSEWVKVEGFRASKDVLVFAYCNDIVNGWVEVLLINRDGELFSPHGIRYPALVTHVMPLTLPTPPKD